jgi:hypothetical protein
MAHVKREYYDDENFDTIIIIIIIINNNNISTSSKFSLGRIRGKHIGLFASQ